MTIATHEDAKSLGYCNTGMRKWFAQMDRGLTFAEFRANGATTEWLRDTGNAMAIKLADYADQRQQAQQG